MVACFSYNERFTVTNRYSEIINKSFKHLFYIFSKMYKRLKETKPTGEAAENLIWCFRCWSEKNHNINEYIYNNEFTEFPWAITIHCPNPEHSSWIVCAKCSFNKKRFTNKPQVMRHHKQFHDNNRNTSNIKRPGALVQLPEKKKTL